MGIKCKNGILKKGNKIYVDGSYYLSHGVDDFDGGLCTIDRLEDGISAGKKVLMVGVVERPGTLYNWEFLKPKQEELKERFGTKAGMKNPDDRIEFNTFL